MRKLLNADFSRLRRDYFFWGMLAFIIIDSLMYCVMTYRTIIKYNISDVSYYMEEAMFYFIPYIEFAIALCNALRIGAEFDRYTIRNKLIVGHTRTEVFFSEYITSFAASEIILFSILIPSGIAGYLFFKEFMFSRIQLLQLVLCIVSTTAVFSAITVGIGMNVHSKTWALVVSLGIFTAMLLLSSYIINRINAAPTTSSYVIYNANGVEYGDPVKNPAYVEGLKRNVFELLADILPTGQCIRLHNLECERAARWPVFSVIMLIISTIAGYIPFYKKDIR